MKLIQYRFGKYTILPKLLPRLARVQIAVDENKPKTIYKPLALYDEQGNFVRRAKLGERVDPFYAKPISRMCRGYYWRYYEPEGDPPIRIDLSLVKRYVPPFKPRRVIEVSDRVKKKRRIFLDLNTCAQAYNLTPRLLEELIHSGGMVNGCKFKYLDYRTVKEKISKKQY